MIQENQPKFNFFSFENDQTPKLVKSFEKYDAENPHVWKLFERFTFEAIDSGRRYFSISLITERIRWELYITTKSDDGFKINNNHRAFYSRKFMERHPQWSGLFRTRQSVADDKLKAANP